MDQARKLSVMFDYLKTNGLHKISFIIINAANSTTYFDDLRTQVNNSNVHIFQDTENKSVWNLLDGRNYDIFVYNRCGKITFHIKHPQSILNSNEPIVQATLLATYYEDLCNGCQDEHSDAGRQIGQSTDYRSRNARKDAVLNERTNETRSQTKEVDSEVGDTIKTSINKEINSTKLYLGKDEILKNSTLNFTDIFIDREEDKSNSSYVFFSPWSIFKFFLSKSSRTFNLTQHQDGSTNQLSSIPSNQGQQVSTQTITTTALLNDKLDNSTLNQSISNSANESKGMNKPVTIKSDLSNASTETDANRMCTSLPEGSNINCSEFSTDKMLAVRLCCLNGNNSILSSGGFSCRKFNQDKCVNILPIIKCCFQNMLSEILDDYFAKSKNETIAL